MSLSCLKLILTIRHDGACSCRVLRNSRRFFINGTHQRSEANRDNCPRADKLRRDRRQIVEQTRALSNAERLKRLNEIKTTYVHANAGTINTGSTIT